MKHPKSFLMALLVAGSASLGTGTAHATDMETTVHCGRLTFAPATSPLGASDTGVHDADVPAEDDRAGDDTQAGLSEADAQRIIDDAAAAAASNPEAVEAAAAEQATIDAAEAAGQATTKDSDLRDADCGGGGAFLPFTAGNFRTNLTRISQVPKQPSTIQAHHMLPQALNNQFARPGLNLNIHDPKYGAWWASGDHQRAAYQYNRAWEEFFDRYTHATPVQVRAMFNQLAKQYGLRTYWK